MLSARIAPGADALGEALGHRVRRPAAEPARPPAPSSGEARSLPSWSGGAPLRLTLPDPGFIAHLLADQELADDPPDVRAVGLDAYRLRLGARVSYSGPVRPVDLWI